MRIKLDENLPISAGLALAQRGHDVDTVGDERLAGASDAEIVAAATATGRLLITLDRGMGDLRRYPPGTHAGIVILRWPDQAAGVIRQALIDLAGSHDLENLAETVTVVQPGLLRVRRR